MNSFVNRLTFLLETYDFNASTFADKIGVQRSSLSHLLSGRNKPSLDFILKVKECFPELNLDWLLQGKGPYSDEVNSSDLNSTSSTLSAISTDQKNNADSVLATKSQTGETKSKLSHLNETTHHLFDDTSVEKIIVFYKDGTFKQYVSR